MHYSFEVQIVFVDPRFDSIAHAITRDYLPLMCNEHDFVGLRNGPSKQVDELHFLEKVYCILLSFEYLHPDDSVVNWPHLELLNFSFARFILAECA